ncbi:S41 family peptidase [Chitinimonas sp. JJ19]|uniref:S41 family peptidase n=1 Tax=Chitinimonas sp. JJ19 TaxID=3109352 RepID=UPI0030019A1E
MQLSRISLALAGLLATVPALAASNGYFRFPALQANTVVFTAEGDLWASNVSGGNARRLTSHAAEETRPALSPDGKWVAFSANYEGATEVYLMPLAGGQPRRLSFENTRATTLGWTAQGEVLYTAQHSSGPSSLRVVTLVNPNTGDKRVLPLADANDAVLDEKGEYVYFVRFGLVSSNDNARHYRGGALSQLWRFNLKNGKEAERIGPANRNLRRPMWWNGRLVLISDSDGRDNLWSMKPDGTELQQLTRHAEFDIRSASLDSGRVVYQLGADLRLLDIASRRDEALDINLVSDFDQMRPRWLDKPLRYASSTILSPDGERVAVTARGRTTLASTGLLRRIDIQQPAGARLREATLSPDGRWVYAIADSTGEHEIWRFLADGSDGGSALTSDGNTQRFGIYPSPDGKWLLHNDKQGRLWLLDLATRKNELIDDASRDGVDEHSDISWAPDSRSIALVRGTNARQMNQIGLYSLESRRMHWLSSDKYNSQAPVFSPDGRWLWFLSDRNFQATNRGPWGDRNTGAYFDRRTKVYALALQAGNRFPFQPKDELQNAKPGGDDKPADKAASKPAEGKETKSSQPAIQYEGLADRLYEVPVAPANYRDLAVDGKRLYLLEAEGSRNDLKTLAIDNTGPKPEVFAADIHSFALSQDGKKLWYRKGNNDNPEMFIVDAGPKAPGDLSKSGVRLGDWSLRIDPREEWRQMYHDAWRMHRDSLYDRQMRGVDWVASRKKFAPLVERVTDRSELDDVLAQLIGEVGSLHSQVGGGDMRRASDGANAAGLGAVLERVANGWEVARIYRTEAELPSERSPLQAPGVDVREGDIIVAVNGRNSAETRDFSDLLRNQAGQQVLLEVRRGNAAVRRVIVTPVDARQQAALRYNDWEQTRKETVEKASNGKLGYLHLRAMGAGDMASFVREFYAQYERDGLIIDVRRNNGGNIDSWVIEKLLRRVWAFWAPPGVTPYGNMQQAFRGHLVVLTDALTYSDGETFAAGVQALKLGPLIGTRTSGAGVWLSDRNTLADEGIARVAENAQFGVDGSWLVEGVGVQPDIEVDNPPHATFKGEDKQLETAINYLRQKLASEPIKPLKAGAIPPLKP